MGRISVGMQQTDGNHWKALFVQTSQQIDTGGFVQGLQHGAVLVQALGYFINMLRGHEAWRLYPQIHIGAFGYIVPTDVQHIATPCGGEQSQRRALALDDHVRSYGRTVQNGYDI